VLVVAKHVHHDSPNASIVAKIPRLDVIGEGCQGRFNSVRIGILTGGGDCPGLNAVIRGIVRHGLDLADSSFVGFRYGWAGVLEDDAVALTRESTAGILPRGGTILGTSRTNPFDGRAGALGRIRDTFERERLAVLIPIGGEDTLGVASRLSEQGLPIVGVPKTIDNDIGGTDVTFGFHTAVQIATDAIDRLHTTAESHNRVMVVEVMGRHAGWIATYAGIAGGADAILVPERPFDVQEVCERLRRRHESGITFSIVVVSEGASPREGDALTATSEADTDEFGHARLGGIGVGLAREVEELTGYETRATILGHVQRGGTPTAYDRVLATRFGVAAVNAAAAGRLGQMVALRGPDIVEVGLREALAEPKLLDPRLFETAEVFFG
jgi:ATP-dependent phosphofructokinase / diphosphate-dependent phosphofructokinase